MVEDFGGRTGGLQRSWPPTNSERRGAVGMNWSLMGQQFHGIDMKFDMKLPYFETFWINIHSPAMGLGQTTGEMQTSVTDLFAINGKMY